MRIFLSGGYLKLAANSRSSQKNSKKCGFTDNSYKEYLADGQLRSERTNQQILPRSSDLIRHANWAYYSEIFQEER